MDYGRIIPLVNIESLRSRIDEYCETDGILPEDLRFLDALSVSRANMLREDGLDVEIDGDGIGGDIKMFETLAERYFSKNR